MYLKIVVLIGFQFLSYLAFIYYLNTESVYHCLRNFNMIQHMAYNATSKVMLSEDVIVDESRCFAANFKSEICSKN